MTSVRDVYAGDLGAVGGDGEAAKKTFLFRLSAEATPDVFLRIAHQFNFANIAPRSVMFETGADGMLEVQVIVAGISGSLADRIARKLDQQLMVTEVTFDPVA